MALPTMDFEVYLNTNAPAPEREQALAELFANEDAAGVEYAVVMPSPTPKPDNHALFETTSGQRRAVLCCQVNPNHGQAALEEIRRSASEWGMRVLKIMPAIYQVHLTGPLAQTLMRVAQELGLVVNIHSGSEISHPLAIGALARRLRFELAQLLFRSRGRSDPPPETGRRGRGVGAGRQPGAHSRHHLNGW